MTNPKQYKAILTDEGKVQVVELNTVIEPGGQIVNELYEINAEFLFGIMHRMAINEDFWVSVWYYA
jgi:hypothetical protein